MRCCPCQDFSDELLARVTRFKSSHDLDLECRGMNISACDAGIVGEQIDPVIC
jgi:hypothetical protein